MNTLENISTLSAVIVGVLLFVASLYSFYIDYSAGKPALNILIDLTLLILSSIIVGGSLNLRKKLVGYKVAAEKAFDEVVYSKIKPVMDEVALGIIEINALKKKLEDVEKKVSIVEELATTQKLTPEQKINFYFKALIVMLFYLGTFVFMTQYTLPYLYLISILLFLYWWLFITYEYNIFHKSEALVMLAAPVLIAPSLYILLRIALGVAAAQGVMFLASAFYAYYYYNLAKKLVGGNANNSLTESLKNGITNLKNIKK
ncbi:hypothetical protein Ferp_0665 [Ferroglobus placidus DSM 10642]|uniref:Uncharacterized protein n=1 Tax=Ferroglobus placidus (strain DSM 10642 / AEDII12DO) TaxID=589924 RepID=D3S3K3_FERPA|nr:hypothetical protein [Ferroglobus placidus]ADC64836.1 hypothetical protein Ferp_0665 [Ferroglobus placidus DSM 10642]